MTLISGQAKSQTTSEIDDEINRPQIIRLYKGDKATYDGALIPFNTLSNLNEIRYNYERLQTDYLKYGVIREDDNFLKDVGKYGAIIFASALVATSISADENRNNMFIFTGLGLAASLTILVF
jgi:hypothetical protein